MPRIETDSGVVGRGMRGIALAVLVSALVLSASPGARAQSVAPDSAPPPAGATDQGTAVVPSAPPGISVTPSTRPMMRPSVPRDQTEPPVEGCPAGENRKLELLV